MKNLHLTCDGIKTLLSTMSQFNDNIERLSTLIEELDKPVRPNGLSSSTKVEIKIVSHQALLNKRTIES